MTRIVIDQHKRSMLKEAGVVTMVKNVADTLNKHYPGHLWAVGPSNDYSMLAIWNEGLSAKYGMWIRVTDIDPEYRNVMRWAGEFLERAKVSRGKVNETEMASLSRDHTGEVKFDE